MFVPCSFKNPSVDFPQKDPNIFERRIDVGDGVGEPWKYLVVDWLIPSHWIPLALTTVLLLSYTFPMTQDIWGLPGSGNSYPSVWALAAVQDCGAVSFPVFSERWGVGAPTRNPGCSQFEVIRAKSPEMSPNNFSVPGISPVPYNGLNSKWSQLYSDDGRLGPRVGSYT